MSHARTTCWTMIGDAAAGDAAARDRFARDYEPAARAYLTARWRGSALAQEVDDALQEVFVELFRDGGALTRVDADRSSGFRAFFFSVVRNIARRCEHRRGKAHRNNVDTAMKELLPTPDEAQLSRVFDRSWAIGVMQQAARRHHEHAMRDGDDAVQRHELLRLRFGEGLPIRVIAARWEQPAEQVHRAYARARREFEQALRETVAFHHPNGNAALIDQSCAELMAALADAR